MNYVLTSCLHLGTSCKSAKVLFYSVPIDRLPKEADQQLELALTVQNVDISLAKDLNSQENYKAMRRILSKSQKPDIGITEEKLAMLKYYKLYSFFDEY